MFKCPTFNKIFVKTTKNLIAQQDGKELRYLLENK